MSAISKRQLAMFNGLFLLLIILLPLFSFVFWGKDFTIGVLVGSLIVSINFYGIQRILRKVINEKRLIYFFSYFAKFLLSISILFVSVYFLQVSSAGIALGVSALFFAVCLFVLLAGLF